MYSESQDNYTWAYQNNIYIEQIELYELIIKQQQKQQQENNIKKFIVVDVRDDDYLGGHIINSHHYPSQNFNLEKLMTFIRKEKIELVIFHCMESVCRGPNAAYHLHTEYCIKNDIYADMVSPQEMRIQSNNNDKKKDETEGKTNKIPEIRILKGGMDQWCRSYHKDPHLVIDFDDEFWGFYDEDDDDDQQNDNDNDNDDTQQYGYQDRYINR